MDLPPWLGTLMDSEQPINPIDTVDVLASPSNSCQRGPTPREMLADFARLFLILIDMYNIHFVMIWYI